MYQNRSIDMLSGSFWVNPSRFLYRGIVKNVIDSIAAFLAIVVLSPLLILIAIRIKQDSPGPILVKQKCEGLKGHPFKMYKFRTHQLIAVGSLQEPKYVLRETYVGKILKEANLENLPQLFNVFMCDMSLVGPRAQLINLKINNVGIDEIIPHYQIRTLVKPGMTGWAQINGLRGPLSTISQLKQRVSYDIDYMKYASFKIDCYILLKTLRLLKSA